MQRIQGKEKLMKSFQTLWKSFKILIDGPQEIKQNLAFNGRANTFQKGLIHTAACNTLSLKLVSTN